MPKMKSNDSGLKALLGCWLLEIEGLELNLGKGGQLLHRGGEERGGNVTESIGVQAPFEQR